MNNNRNFFLNIFSAVLAVYGLAALPSVFAAAYYEENDALYPLLAVSLISVAAASAVRHIIDKDTELVRPRMNFLVTMNSWLIILCITAVVLWLCKAGLTADECIFEAASYLTTTGTGSLGASDLPRSLMLWRSSLNWLGGIGLILTAVSCLRGWHFSGHTLVSVEMQGPDFLESFLSYKATYRNILKIYAGLTAVHFVLMCLAGMTPYDSLMTSLSNMSTAGLQHIDNGVITALPVSQKIIITAFSFIGSVNVSLLLALFIKGRFSIRKNSETVLYASRIIVTALIIWIIMLVKQHTDPAGSFADALMQTVSFLSTSGYIAARQAEWPFICRLLIILQLFIGACAASTAGGIKTARLQIGFRTARFGLFRHIHPRSVRPVSLNGSVLKPEHLVQANLYISLFMFTYLAGALLLSIDNSTCSVTDALSYSQAMLTNTGTTTADIAGHAAVHFSPFSRIVMSVLMLAGRLEIYPVLMLFFKSFWKSDSNK